jgi:hypothetical protein
MLASAPPCRLFSLYNLMRPRFAPVAAGKAADGAIGVLNGVIGGATGLAGIAVTIWCTLRVGRAMSNVPFSSRSALRFS